MTFQPEPEGLLERIRTQCAEVTRRARFVRVEDSALELFSSRLAEGDWPEEDLDPGHDFEGDAETQLAFTLLLDAINFGSGWFPVLTKRPGFSGYQTIAAACRSHFESEGRPSTAALKETRPEWMANLLGQDFSHPEVAELMRLFAQAWREFGAWLDRTHGGRFESVVESAEGSAERLVRSLSELPLYRDVSRYAELDVPLYKRAQITVADLNRVFPRSSLGRFADLNQLTLFADNLVPHVLRCHGILVYDDELAAKIDRRERIESGSQGEIEIRAVAVEAVERMVRVLETHGRSTSAHVLDGLLWNAGQAPEIKASPRHRTRCTYY